MQTPSVDVTRLLLAWGGGDKNAFDELVTVVYGELRAQAERALQREQQEHYRGKPHTLAPTELVNEAWLRLVDQQRVSWKNRGHFFAVCGMMMRRVLTDHARARYQIKRGRGFTLFSLDDDAARIEIGPDKAGELIALDDALTALGKHDPRKVQIVELRFFAGLTMEEIASFLETTPDTVRSQWRFAKAWLFREISKEGSPAEEPNQSHSGESADESKEAEIPDP